MKLSEAIRLGAMALPPVYGPAFRCEGGRYCGACAIGAPLYAIFGDRTHDELRRRYGYDDVGVVIAAQLAFVERWPWTAMEVQCPAYRFAYAQPVVSAMVNLFEHHKWTREQIADWVATIEPPEQSAPIEDEAEDETGVVVEHVIKLTVQR